MKSKISNRIFYVWLIFVFVFGMILTPVTTAGAEETDINPYNAVRMTQNAVIEWGWPCGASITLTIDDPANGSDIDYTDTHLACQGDSSPYDYLGFWLGNDFQVRPGYFVTVTGSGVSKTHIVKEIRVKEINYEQDVISGVCSPGARVYLNFHNAFYRSVVSDDLGNWTVDFSQPGTEPEEQSLYDVTPIIEGPVQCFDSDPGDLDSTLITYPVSFAVYPGGDIWGNNWLTGEEVTLVIEDPNTGESPDYVATATPEVGPWFLTGVGIPLGGIFEVQPGQIVTLSQTGIAKSHVVSDTVEITSVDSDDDLIRGSAIPSAYILVMASPGDGGYRTVRADQYGNWLADFSISSFPWEGLLDITSESNIAAGEYDDDSDHTVVNWQWPWTLILKGFYQPVDMNGVFNIVKNGSTVPLKFEVFAGSTELTDVAFIKSLTYGLIACQVDAPSDEIELTAIGNTSLRYDTTAGQFIYNWKTPNTAGRCYRVRMTTNDGSSLVAYFKLK